MTIPPEKEQRLKELMQVFLEENQKINLSAYRTEEQCWVGNVLDAVSGLRDSESGQWSNVIDVGTGGGFPLLPLAVMMPDVSFIGIDATKKKIDAVQRIVDKLGLKNVSLGVGRAEELGGDSKYREQFDVVLSRAVAPLNVLLEYMSPFCKVNGQLICWKSMDCEDELQASIDARIKVKCRLIGRHEYELPGDWGSRQLLVFEKTGALSKKFPRGVGEAKKKPL